MKERILFVCLGGGAGNIGMELQRKGFYTMYINTSNDDLETVEVANQHQLLHIAGAFGCNKNRKKAQLYAMENIDLITDAIEKRYPQINIVYMISCIGGGTGSGFISLLTEAMINKNPHKYYGMVIVLPSLKEQLQNLKNSAEAYGEITQIQGLKNVYILDNNNIEDKFEINRQFADRFDKLMNITIPDVRGVIDPAELEELLTTEGNTIINVEDDISNLFNHNIFTAYPKGYKNVGLLLKDDMNLDNIQCNKLFVGYNDEYNLGILTGMPYPTSRIEDIIKAIEVKESNLISKDSINIQIPKYKSNTVTKPVIREKVDFNKIFAKYM